MSETHAAGPFAVDETEHTWIPMPDGTRLSARIWRPGDVGPVPALLEYIPYRKRDLVRARDARNHPFFASHGYACLRVDMRGSGDSEGHMPDMYSDDELADARHVIDWIAAQPWCDGGVGMFGTSWGGTASLQAAVDAPAALKAVLANCATINRFEDDIHWMGGCLLTDSFEWGATLPAILAAPPDTATVCAGWRHIWQDRLDRLTFPLASWVQQDQRGRYWRHGSVRFQADRLSCPVLAIGGWADRYSSSVMRLVSARPDLCHGIVGPWGHHYPDQGEPGPAMDFQGTALTWWDHWLKGKRLPDWPHLRFWERAFEPPQDRITQRAGRWMASAGDVSQSADFFVHPDGLHNVAGPEVDAEIPVDLLHGACAGDTGYFGRPGGLPLEQSPDDARCLSFDSAPLEEDLVLAGEAELNIDVPTRTGQLVARICAVDETGRSLLVTRTVVNLALNADLDAARNSSRIVLRFLNMAYRFQKGHRLRLSLGDSYWPLVWPSFAEAVPTVTLGTARLQLPRLADLTPTEAPPSARTYPAEPLWEVTPHDGPFRRNADGWHSPRTTISHGDIAVDFTSDTKMRYRCDPDQNTCACEITVTYEIARPDGTALIESYLTAEGSLEGLKAQGTLRALWQGEEVAKLPWELP